MQMFLEYTTTDVCFSVVNISGKMVLILWRIFSSFFVFEKINILFTPSSETNKTSTPNITHLLPNLPPPPPHKVHLVCPNKADWTHQALVNSTFMAAPPWRYWSPYITSERERERETERERERERMIRNKKRDEKKGGNQSHLDMDYTSCIS